MASSAFTDSASPGRNDEDSFFWTPSNLPAWEARPMKNTRARARTTYLERRPAGSVSMSTGSTGRACHSDSRDRLVGLRHDLIPGHADDAVAVGLEAGLFGGVVLTGDGRVVELGAVGFDR